MIVNIHTYLSFQGELHLQLIQKQSIEDMLKFVYFIHFKSIYIQSMNKS